MLPALAPADPLSPFKATFAEAVVVGHLVTALRAVVFVSEFDHGAVEEPLGPRFWSDSQSDPSIEREIGAGHSVFSA